MKYLLYTLEYPPFHGGVANYYGNLVKFWPFTQAENMPPAEPLVVLNNNNNQLINNRLPLLKWLPAIKALRRTVKRENIGHVLVGQILPLGTAAWLVSKFSGFKYSVFIHGTDLNFALTHFRRRWLAKKILTGAQLIICNSNYAASLCSNFIGKNDKIKVVNPGIESRFAVNPELAAQLKNKFLLQDKIILLTVGRLVERKGVDKILEALPEILKKVPNLFYVVIGNGPELSKLQAKITDQKLEKHAIVLTESTDQERNAWYDLCDIFILAGRQIGSDVEGFGIVYLEAGLHGKPVIAGDSGGVRDAVEDNLNGLLIDPTDTAAIARAITGLAQDETLRRQLGQQGRERATMRFSWEKQITKLHKLISN